MATGFKSQTTAAKRNERRATLLASSLYVVGCLITSVLVLRRPASDQLADLKVYLGANNLARAGGNLYDYHAANGDPFTYPPFAGLLLTPLTWLPVSFVETLWTAATFAAVVSLAAILLRALGLPASLAGWRPWSLATVLLLSAPVQSNIRFGQVSLFLALAVFAGLLAARCTWGAVAVGLATSIKLTPGIFMADLLIARRWRLLGTTLLVLVLSAAAAWFWQPQASSRFWTEALYQTSRIGDLTQTGNQSIYGVLGRSAMGSSWLQPTWLAMSAVVAAAGLYQAQRLRRGGQRAEALVVLGLVSVAVSPVSWVHHQVWIVLAAIYVVRGSGQRWRVIGALLYVVMVVDLNVSVVLPSVPVWLAWLSANLRGVAVVAICLVGLPRQQRSDAGNQNLPKP